MLALLVQSINPLFNSTYYDSLMSESLKQSIINIISEQSKTINKLSNQLRYNNQPLGTVRLTVADSRTSFIKYRLSYSNHKLDSDKYTSFVLYTYRPQYLYEQIRDYVCENELSLIQCASTNNPPNNALLRIENGKFENATELINSIINDTAPMKTLVRNRAFRSNSFVENNDPTTPYDKTVAFNLNYIPYYQFSNYYMRRFGYINNDQNVRISLVSDERKELALTLDGWNNCLNADESRVEDLISEFIYDLKQWRLYDPEYKGVIITRPRSDAERDRHRWKKYAQQALTNLHDILYDNPYNVFDVNNEPDKTEIPIKIIVHDIGY